MRNIVTHMTSTLSAHFIHFVQGIHTQINITCHAFHPSSGCQNV